MTSLFYDELAPFYHLLYENWDRAIETQGAALAGLLESLGVAAGDEILDAACGIGTQALGLAARGYRVSGSDLSAAALARLEKEAASRRLVIKTCVGDLRMLACAANDSANAVLACDNSLPHLLTDADLRDAFRSALRVLKPRGLAVYSVRDYAKESRVSPDVRPYGIRYEGQQRFLATQVWEWHGDQYELRLYLTHDSGDGTCSSRVLVTRYHAISIDRLMLLMREAGFSSVERSDDVLFQPVIWGRR